MGVSVSSVVGPFEGAERAGLYLFYAEDRQFAEHYYEPRPGAGAFDLGRRRMLVGILEGKRAGPGSTER